MCCTRGSEPLRPAQLSLTLGSGIYSGGLPILAEHPVKIGSMAIFGVGHAIQGGVSLITIYASRAEALRILAQPLCLFGPAARASGLEVRL